MTPEVNGDTTELSAASPKTKSPFKLVNEHHRSSKNKITDEELLSEFGTFCMELAESPKQCCKKCCLRCLADKSVSAPVSSYLLQFVKKHVTTHDQTLVDWVRSAHANRPHKNAPLLFNLPFDATNSTPEATRHLHAQDRICKVALMQLFDFGKTKWSRISRISKTTTIATTHGLKGKSPNCSKADTELLAPLNNHLNELCDLGEPIATQIVREVTGLIELHDKEDSTIYLPMVMTKWAIYRNYCRELGWWMITKPKGGYHREWVGNGPEPATVNIVSWRSFRRHWKANYPHLKVSTKREDICNHCFVVANASKYNFAAAHLEEVSLGSMAKDVLCIDCNEDEEDFSDDGEDDLISLGSQDGSTVGLGVTGGKQAATVVALEGVVNMMIEYNSVEYATKEKRTAGITIPQFQ